MSAVRRICPYPVGEIRMSTDATDPSEIWPGTVWERIRDCVLMAAGASYAAGSTGGAASHTLTADELPSHSHGLNSHTHSVGAHKHTVPEHGHTYTRPTVSSSGQVAGGITGGSHSHTALRHNLGGSTSGWGEMSENGKAQWEGSYIGSSTHTHDLPNHTHTLTGGSVANKAAFDTNNSTTFNSGAASGNTEAAGGGAAFSTLPPYLAVYVWRRTA